MQDLTPLCLFLRLQALTFPPILTLQAGAQASVGFSPTRLIPLSGLGSDFSRDIEMQLWHGKLLLAHSKIVCVVAVPPAHRNGK